jgi:hypothetical protein
MVMAMAISGGADPNICATTRISFELREKKKKKKKERKGCKN